MQRKNISRALHKDQTPNDIWRNIDSNIRLFDDGCTIHRKITNKNNIGKLQNDLGTLGKWAAENGMN